MTDAPPDPPACKGCKSLEPTCYVVLRGNVGKIVKVLLSKIEGRYCFRCGDRWFRHMARLTLVKGWWSPMSLFLAPWFLFTNAREHARLCRETRVRPPLASLLVRGAALLPLLVLAGLVTLYVMLR